MIQLREIFTMTYFKTFLPSPVLRHVVEYYWRSIIPLKESLTQEVPTPLMQGMTFNLNRLTERMVFSDNTMEMKDYCYLFGQPAKHRLSLSNPTGVDILGVKFTSTGLHTLTGMGMRHLADNIVSAEGVWGREVEWLCEAMYEAGSTLGMIQVLEQFLYKKLKSSRRELNKSLEAALYFMHHNIYSLKEIKERTFLSERTLERYFASHIGLSPKKYARICRFNAVKEALDKNPSRDWHEMIYSFGYFDKSHFIKEFKTLSGKTPGQYLSELSEPSVSLF